MGSARHTAGCRVPAGLPPEQCREGWPGSLSQAGLDKPLHDVVRPASELLACSLTDDETSPGVYPSVSYRMVPRGGDPSTEMIQWEHSPYRAMDAVQIMGRQSMSLAGIPVFFAISACIGAQRGSSCSMRIRVAVVSGEFVILFVLLEVVRGHEKVLSQCLLSEMSSECN